MVLSQLQYYSVVQHTSQNQCRWYRLAKRLHPSDIEETTCIVHSACVPSLSPDKNEVKVDRCADLHNYWSNFFTASWTNQPPSFCAAGSD